MPGGRRGYRIVVLAAEWSGSGLQVEPPGGRLAGLSGTDVVDGQSDEDPSLLHHGPPVVVPVGVLTGDAAE